MQDVIAKFIELQKLEDEIIDAARVLEEGPLRLAASLESLEEARAAHESVSSGLRDAKISLKTLELDMMKLKELREGNRARTTKATGERSYKAVLTELDSIKKLIAENEEGTLELLEKSEALKAELPVAEEGLKDAEAAHEELSLSVEEDMARAKAVADSRQAAVDAILATIDPAAAERFTASAKAHNGKAMAAVTDGTCQVCRIRIPPQLYNELQSHSKLMTCPSCARIMHFVPPAPKEEAPQKKPAKRAKKPVASSARA
ncbi:MAG: C4-type zinc ribbon domain-containing protein [Deltaproteobacteria bacterium]|nr:C4-type zinc ribbon domain-containing protein [Deltaproteobacteria bacterium]